MASVKLTGDHWPVLTWVVSEWDEAKAVTSGTRCSCAVGLSAAAAAAGPLREMRVWMFAVKVKKPATSTDHLDTRMDDEFRPPRLR